MPADRQNAIAVILITAAFGLVAIAILGAAHGAVATILILMALIVARNA